MKKTCISRDGVRPGLWMMAMVLLSLQASAWAWSNKEHIQLTRLAVGRLIANPDTPAGMKDWLRKACPDLLTVEEERAFFVKKRIGLVPRGVDGVCYWAIMPDMMALMSGSGENEKKVEPFGVSERLLHYIDLELFIKEEHKRRYAHNLSNKPVLLDDKFFKMKDPEDGNVYDTWKRAGMLPFRVEQCYFQLVKAIREKKLVDTMGQFPRDEHATKWAGYLAHYLQDNTQPHHATEDYKSRAYFADKRNAPNVHWDMEGRLMDDEENDYLDLREEFWGIFEKKLDEVIDETKGEQLIRGTIEVAMTSYDALPLIGQAAMKAYKQGGTPENPEGKTEKFDANVFFHFKGKYLGKTMTVMEMKAHQMAWSVKRVERLWRMAWDEAQQPVEKP